MHSILLRGGCVVLAVLAVCGGARADSLFYANTVLSQGPYAYWRLNEAVGPTAVDASGNARNATINGAPTLGAPGPQDPAFIGFTATNTAFQFPDNTAHYVTANLTGLGDNYTASMWVRNLETVNTSAVTAYLFSRGSAANNATADHFGISGTFAAPEGNLFLFNGNTLNQSAASNPAEFSNGDATWHHVAFTRNGTTVAMYFDGALATSTAGFGVPFGAADDFITLARRNDALFPLGGLLDEVAVFDRVLTGAEILSQYQSAFNTPAVSAVPEPGTLALFSACGLLWAGTMWRRRRQARA